MNYVIRITYKDDKTVAILVPKEKVKDYFDKLSGGEVFINEETSIGFWTTVDQIRHIIVQEAREIQDEQEKDKLCVEMAENGEGDKEIHP